MQVPISAPPLAPNPGAAPVAVPGSGLAVAHAALKLLARTASFLPAAPQGAATAGAGPGNPASPPPATLLSALGWLAECGAVGVAADVAAVAAAVSGVATAAGAHEVRLQPSGLLPDAPHPAKWAPAGYVLRTVCLPNGYWCLPYMQSALQALWHPLLRHPHWSVAHAAMQSYVTLLRTAPQSYDPRVLVPQETYGSVTGMLKSYLQRALPPEEAAAAVAAAAAQGGGGAGKGEVLAEAAVASCEAQQALSRAAAPAAARRAVQQGMDAVQVGPAGFSMCHCKCSGRWVRGCWPKAGNTGPVFTSWPRLHLPSTTWAHTARKASELTGAACSPLSEPSRTLPPSSYRWPWKRCRQRGVNTTTASSGSNSRWGSLHVARSTLQPHLQPRPCGHVLQRQCCTHLYPPSSRTALHTVSCRPYHHRATPRYWRALKWIIK